MNKDLMNRQFVSRMSLSVLGVVCFTLAAFSLTGCSTVEGIGKDIQYASQQTAEALNGDK